MKTYQLFLLIILPNLNTSNRAWISEKHPAYNIHYTFSDKQNKNEYIKSIDQGIKAVTAFFQSPYKKHFEVFIQPDRASFDKAYQQNYNQPNFKSDCWLIATGDGFRINILSSNTWAKEPCTSRYSEYSEKAKTQKLITHELVHVFHGQLNKDPALNNGSGMDWFAEGLAFYASRQLDASEIKNAKRAVINDKIPASLNAISTFQDIGLRYSLCGSLALYIDKTYGRAKLKSLLAFSKKEELLIALKTTEPELLADWQKFMRKPGL